MVTTFKNDAWTVFNKTAFGYVVQLYSPAGDLRDKIVSDDYRNARRYHRSFNKIAKQWRA